MLTSQDPKKIKYHSENLKLIDLFKTEVHDRSKEIDESNELDWYALTLGWALAKDLSPSLAHDFALHIRYSTDLG